MPYIFCVIIQAVSHLGRVVEDTSHWAAANLNCFVSQCSLKRDTDLEAGELRSPLNSTWLYWMALQIPALLWIMKFEPEIISLDPAIFNAESQSHWWVGLAGSLTHLGMKSSCMGEARCPVWPWTADAKAPSSPLDHARRHEMKRQLSKRPV